MTKTVKARVHHGAESLDLTVPAEVVRKYDINPGDIFEIRMDNGDEIVIEYSRIYENE